MRTSTGKPTQREQARFDMFPALGCICCLLRFGTTNLSYDVHHIISGGRRLGHWWSLPLCPQHHRYKGTGPWTSIANGSKAFSRIHGTELDLWLKVQHILNLDDEFPPSKIVPRRVHG